MTGDIGQNLIRKKPMAMQILEAPLQIFITIKIWVANLEREKQVKSQEKCKFFFELYYMLCMITTEQNAYQNALKVYYCSVVVHVVA